MNNSLVSIITPFYNSEKYFSDTIESVLAQSYPYWELLCVDDGSQDESARIVESFAKTDSRVKLFRRDGSLKGPSICRNYGVSVARGKYCIFLDSDDLLSPKCLEKRVAAIESSDYYFVVFPMASFTDDVRKYSIISNLNAKHFEYFFASSVSAWPVTSTIIKRDYINRLGAFNEKMFRLEDVEFHLRAILFSNGNYSIIKKQQPDCFYRITSIKNRFILKKFESSQQPLIDYINKVLQYKSFFKDTSLLSTALLIILLNIIYVHCIIKLKGGKLVPIDTREAYFYLLKKDRLVYWFINKIPFTRPRLVFAALIRKLMLKKL